MRNKVKRTQQGVTVEFTGEVISNDDKLLYQFFDWEYICPKDIEAAIDMAEGKPILLRMNSHGGSTISGAEIYSRLMDYPGPVTVDILSLSASASSVVSMVAAKEGNRCRISPLGMMIVHNVQNQVQGDYRDMEEAAENLRKVNSTIIAAYQKKTGLQEAQLQAMLNKETWLTAREALEMGFADEVMFEEGYIPEDVGLTNAIMTKTRELMNAMPSIDHAALRRMLDARRPEEDGDKRDRDMAVSLQFAAMQLELEKNRF